MNSQLLVEPVKRVGHGRADLAAGHKIVVGRVEALLELVHLGLGRLGRAFHHAEHAGADSLALIEARRRVAVALLAPHERHVLGVALLADQGGEREQFAAVGAAHFSCTTVVGPPTSLFLVILYPGTATLSRVSNYPYLYILYSTLRYELWKLERVALRVALATVPGTRELLDGR